MAGGDNINRQANDGPGGIVHKPQLKVGKEVAPCLLQTLRQAHHPESVRTRQLIAQDLSHACCTHHEEYPIEGQVRVEADLEAATIHFLPSRSQHLAVVLG